MIPIRDSTKRRRAPLLTLALIALNLGAFLWELRLPPELLDRAVHVLGVVPARLEGHPLLWGTVLTSMFLHGGWLHLGGNLLYLWIFGDNVEDVLGRPRFLLLYLACGFAAAAAHVWASPGSTVPAIGASGAIAGVLGAYLVAFPRAKVVTVIPVLVFPIFVTLPAVTFLGIWFASQLLSGSLSLGVPTVETQGVAWWAHIGGFVAGVVLLFLLKPAKRTRR